MNDIKCNIFDKISIILNYFEKNEKIDILNDDFFHFIYTNYIFKNKNNNNDNLQMNLDKNNNLILSNDKKNIEEENQKEKEKYKYRFLGIYNALLGRPSKFRGFLK